MKNKDKYNKQGEMLVASLQYRGEKFKISWGNTQP